MDDDQFSDIFLCRHFVHDLTFFLYHDRFFIACFAFLFSRADW